MPEISCAKKDATRRLKITAGHLNKIIEMIQDDVYCLDVIQQAAAVRGAIKKAEEVLLSNHLKTCVVRSIKTNDEEKTISELIELYRKIN
ncbi:metal-sensing transcriptional repressor [Candidatus Falkowbacteria bacterium]|nr:metal-sensing transcriptional repressor [Candidatus Falkowbacteria bacterium]